MVTFSFSCLTFVSLFLFYFFFNIISKYCVSTSFSKANVISVILDFLSFLFLLSLLKRKKDEKGTNASFLRHNIVAYFCSTLK